MTNCYFGFKVKETVAIKFEFLALLIYILFMIWTAAREERAENFALISASVFSGLSANNYIGGGLVSNVAERLKKRTASKDEGKRAYLVIINVI